MKTTSLEAAEFRRILVPLDFSAPSLGALRAAVTLARRFGSRLAVVHVTRRHPSEGHGAGERLGINFDTLRDGRAKLQALIDREVPGELQPTRIVAEGVPFDEIAKAARSWGADLIVKFGG